MSERQPPAGGDAGQVGHLHHRSWGSDDWQALLAAHFGSDDSAQGDPASLLRLTSDGTALAELLQTLEAGELGSGMDLSAPIFSEKTMNAIMGEQMREMAADVLKDAAAQQPGQPGPSAPAEPSSQTLLRGQSSGSMMTLHEATAALQAAHDGTSAPPALPPPLSMPAASLPVPTQQLAATQLALPSVGVNRVPVILQQAQPAPQLQIQQQQYVTLLDGRVLQRPDGSAVLASLPPGQQQLTVPIAGSGSVLQYVPVLESRVVSLAPGQVVQQAQVHVGGIPHLQGTVLEASAPAAVPVAASQGLPADISTTNQLVAAAAAQQQLLQMQTEAAQLSPMKLQKQQSAPEAAVAAMAEAAAALAEVSAPLPQAHIPTMAGVGAVGMGITMPHSAAPQPPSLDMLTIHGCNSSPPNALPAPQLRPASNAPFPTTLAPAVATTAAAMAAPDPSSGQFLPAPVLRPACHPPLEGAGSAETVTLSLPTRPCHKRERSMRSAAPHLADPSTAPTVKASKGEGTPGSLGTSPVSPCNMMEGIFASSSSGEASPLGSMPSSALTAAAAVAAGLMFTPGQGSTPQGAGPGAQQAAAAGGGSVAGPSSVAGTDADALAAIIDATLAPKPGKRRGRPPGRARTAIIPTEEASAALEPTDAEILERLLQEDPSRRAFPPEELKKLVRREKNRITAAISRQRTQVYTAHLESQVKRLEAEQAALAGWLQAPPQGAPHRVLLSGPLVTSDGAAEQGAAGLMPPPPVRHLSL